MATPKQVGLICLWLIIIVVIFFILLIPAQPAYKKSQNSIDAWFKKTIDTQVNKYKAEVTQSVIENSKNKSQ